MNALFTVNAGNFLSQNARESFQAAAERWGALYWEEILNLHGAPAAMKLLAFKLMQEAGHPITRVLVMDADAVIRADAPNPFERFPEPICFYAVHNEQRHLPYAYREANPTMARDQLVRLRDAQERLRPVLTPDVITDLSTSFFNSGVWLASREFHAELLAEALDYFVHTPGMTWWDQMPLNAAVRHRLGGYVDMGAEWNYQFPQIYPRMSTYVYHFAGDPRRYETIKRVNWRAA